MEAAQLQPPPEESPAGTLEDSEPTEPPSPAASEERLEGPRLAAVRMQEGQVEAEETEEEEEQPERAPDFEEEGEEERAERSTRTARKVQPAAREERAEGKEEKPSRDMVNRFRRRMREAATAEERAEALKYGLDRGIPEARELAEAARLAAGAAPAPAQPPPAPQPSAPPGQQNPPAGQPAAPAAEPLIMGQPRKAVQRAAEQGLFLARMCEGLGKMVGWTAPPSDEPVTLFDGIPGVEPIKVTGNPTVQLAELVSVELAALTNRAGGTEDSPFKRRVQIGVMVLSMTGPGLMPLAFNVGGRALGMLKGASRAVAGQVHRWRRK